MSFFSRDLFSCLVDLLVCALGLFDWQPFTEFLVAAFCIFKVIESCDCLWRRPLKHWSSQVTDRSAPQISIQNQYHAIYQFHRDSKRDTLSSQLSKIVTPSLRVLAHSWSCIIIAELETVLFFSKTSQWLWTPLKLLYCEGQIPKTSQILTMRARVQY